MLESIKSYIDQVAPRLKEINDPGFLPETARYLLYTLGLTVVGASMAFIFPITAIAFWMAFGLQLVSLGALIYYQYGRKSYQTAFKWMLAFATLSGFLMGPWLVSISMTLAHGPMLIMAALVTTIAMTAAMFAYAQNSGRDFSTWGSFLYPALMGLLVSMVVSLFFPSPAFIFVRALFGVAIFSATLSYNFFLLRTGEFSTPIQATMAIFTNVLNIFRDILIVLIMLDSGKQDGLDKPLANILTNLILPIVLVLASIFTIGKLDEYLKERRDASANPKFTSSTADMTGKMEATPKASNNIKNDAQYDHPTRPIKLGTSKGWAIRSWNPLTLFGNWVNTGTKDQGYQPAYESPQYAG